MGSQEDIFLNGEGDAWYLRNKSSESKSSGPNLIVNLVKELNLCPKNVLEIGSSDIKNPYG